MHRLQPDNTALIPHRLHVQYPCCALFRTLQIQLKLSRSMAMRKTILLEIVLIPNHKLMVYVGYVSG